ncbi:MAG: hypothetical protein O2955_00695 [Planctomycetota bacterium]|nr:hypothetical protein [Planctomycetota bacterium]MDA1210999.1 hypothetical protein [Planctomycetota bacterium]
MNYFAHGLRFLNRPYFLAGTAVPDWLSVADRATRMHSKRVLRFLDEAEGIEREIAAGVLQHLYDDDWFHTTRAFVEISGQLTLLFRQILSGHDNVRTSVLGHIGTEMLLDGCLIAESPRLLDNYYDAISSVDAAPIQSVINRIAKIPTTRLEIFIPLFQREQFLRDYQEPKRLLVRLNQVMSRIKLSPLPPEAESVLLAGRTLVTARRNELLPSKHFTDKTHADMTARKAKTHLRIV